VPARGTADPRRQGRLDRVYDAHAEEHAELTGDLSAAWSKLEGYGARLALVVHCVRVVAGDPTLADPEAVDETSIGPASRYRGGSGKRLPCVRRPVESEDDRDRRRLVELIQRKGGRATPRDLMRGRACSLQRRTPRPRLRDWSRQVAGVGTRRPRWGRRPAVRRFVLNAVDRVDADETGAKLEENEVLSTSHRQRPDDAGLLCPDGEQPPDDVRYACCPEVEEADEGWGEL